MNRVRVVVGTLLTKYYCGQGRDLEDFSLHLQDDENCPELRSLRRGICLLDFHLIWTALQLLVGPCSFPILGHLRIVN